MTGIVSGLSLLILAVALYVVYKKLIKPQLIMLHAEFHVLMYRMRQGNFDIYKYIEEVKNIK